jgi:3-hydroxybutyrate dehydrogenase
MQHVAPIEQFPVDKWDAILAINLTAVFHAVRAAIPAMREQQWGRVISTGTFASRLVVAHIYMSFQTML